MFSWRACRRTVLRMTINPVLATEPASPDQAVAWFAAKLAVQTDVSDVQRALAGGAPGFTLVDSRDLASWRQGTSPAPSTCPPP
jgi:hypothetical protein